MKKVIDSALWLEYFANTPNAQEIAPYLEDIDNVLVPAHSITELARTLMPQIGEKETLRILAHIQQATVIPMESPLALLAARICFQNQLNFSEGMYLAVAEQENAKFYTFNPRLESIESVRLIRKKDDLKSFRLYR